MSGRSILRPLAVSLGILLLAWHYAMAMSTTQPPACPPEVQRRLPTWEAQSAVGDPPAQYFLGLALLEGTCALPDPVRGLALLRESVFGGVPLGIDILVQAALDGAYGQPKDPREALAWLTVGYRLAPPESPRRRQLAAQMETILAGMTPAQEAHALARARTLLAHIRVRPPQS